MSSVEPSHVEITRDGAVEVLRLARPEKKNALTAAMYAALADALAAGESDGGVAVHVITGSGGAFCAGNDIADFQEAARTGLADTLRFIRLLPKLEKPLVAAVAGPAIGIGTTLLLHCDLVYAAETAMLATPFVDLALVPEAGSSLLLPARVGHARAYAMLALGEPMTAAAAHAAGLVNAVVPEADLEKTALGAARRLAAKPPEALRLTKRLMRGDPAPLAARIEEEIELFRQRLASAEAREAFAAFLEKRKPDFSPPGDRKA
jgi:enoyl-CoA hydratase/carnithine racemase